MPPAAGSSVSPPTVTSYIDGGIVPALPGIGDYNAVAGHPVVGASWEGFVIENLRAAAPPRMTAGFYRTSAGAEIDLILELPGRQVTWAIEIKRGLSVAPSKGFRMVRPPSIEACPPPRVFAP